MTLVSVAVPGTRSVASRLLAANEPLLCTSDYRVTDRPGGCVTGHAEVRLGPVDVVRYEGFGLHRVERKPQHIQADQLDAYLVSIPLHSRHVFRQAGPVQVLEPGSFALLSTSLPFTGSVCGASEHETFCALHLRVDGVLMRRRLPHAESCVAIPIRMRPGTGVMLRHLAELAVAEGLSLSAAESERLGSMLIDAITNATAEAPEVRRQADLPSNPTYLRIARQAREFIDGHLSDPNLDTEGVAAHCHVSKRYLQAVFADAGETVRLTIRELRLQRCREALRSPALRHQSITQIAMRWGFIDLPYFCRAYKERFEHPPSRDRDAP